METSHDSIIVLAISLKFWIKELWAIVVPIVMSKKTDLQKPVWDIGAKTNPNNDYSIVKTNL